jgi:hypothetical protein
MENLQADDPTISNDNIAVDPPMIVVDTPTPADDNPSVIKQEKRRNKCCDAKTLQGFLIAGLILLVGGIFATPFIVRAVTLDQQNAYHVSYTDSKPLIKNQII